MKFFALNLSELISNQNNSLCLTNVLACCFRNITRLFPSLEADFKIPKLIESYSGDSNTLKKSYIQY